MKFRLHKCILLFTAIFSILLILAGCSISSVPAASVDDAEIDYGKSELYSKEDMDAAIEIIKAEFSTWKGCELHSITYCGDDTCNERNVAYVNQLREANNVEEVLTQCIVFKSSFHTPQKSDGGFEADEEYTNWSWYLGRSETGDWKLMTWGY